MYGAAEAPPQLGDDGRPPLGPALAVAAAPEPPYAWRSGDRRRGLRHLDGREASELDGGAPPRAWSVGAAARSSGLAVPPRLIERAGPRVLDGQ